MIGRLMQVALVATGLMGSALVPVSAQAPAQTLAQSPAQKAFVSEDLASRAIRLESALKAEGSAAASGRTGQQLRRDGETFLSRGLVQNALASFTAAIAAEPANSANWLAYARVALAIDPGNDWDLRYKLRDRRATAAYQAYQKAANPADEAAALALLGQGYADQQSWRPSLNAYAASLKVRDNPDIRATYEALRAEHGFRITDYKVDSDSASPRVCFQFSEPLAAQGRLHALRRGVGRGQCRRHGGGRAALRRRAEARRALRRRAAPGPAVRRRREPAEVGRLRDLRPRPLPAGALHRPQLRAAAHRPGGHPGRLGQHRRRSMSRSTASATAACCRPCAPTISWASSDATPPPRSAARRASRSGTARSTRRNRAQPGRDHRLPGARGGRPDGARRLRDDGASPRRPGFDDDSDGDDDYDGGSRRSGSSSPISASPPSRAATASRCFVRSLASAEPRRGTSRCG